MDSFARQGADSLAALALDLVLEAKAAPAGLVFIDATGDRLTQLAAAAAGFAPDLDVLPFPAWDTLPYDRLPPSAGVIGPRVATLARLAAEPGRPRLVITSARAVLGRVPPPEHWRDAAITLRPGEAIDTVQLAESLHEFGYTEDEHVDEPGQMAVRAHVVDIFPGDADAPLRLPIADARIEAIHRVDPVSQRSIPASETELVVRPVVEMDPAQDLAALVCVLAYLPHAAIRFHDEVPTRWPELQDQILDAYAATARARRAGAAAGGPAFLAPPAQLFATAAELGQLLARHDATAAPQLGHAAAIAGFHRPAALARAIRHALAAGRCVIAAGARAGRLQAALARQEVPVLLASGWQDAEAGPAGTAAILSTTLDAGFARDGIQVLAFVAPSRARASSRLTLEEPPRLGDIVVHRGHGVCRLRGLAEVGDEERVALEFAGDTELLVPVDELDQIWRYGSEAGAQALDRIDGEAWHRREHEITEEIAATAKGLAAEAAARAELRAPVIDPPEAGFARFVRRFAYQLSPDQAEAIETTLADLGSGRPMDRLVCGDVGFGKTEIALRAAAAVALAGYQVAVIAPTTVLARQHADTFTRRFAGLGVRVAAMLRGADSEAVRDGLEDGSIGVVVGTQAVAADAVRFKALALVVIDEEQRFGDAQKKRLTSLRNPAGGVHSLLMTATPIPRTLQAAMVGLREVSVIATAPVRRQPTRTFVLPWDGVTVREALLREHARGGQSFVVCPRIEDIGPAAARLADIVPELSIVTAHGRLKPQALEEVIAGFAAGEHDVLLATNIIEAGLDIPRANTILVMRPDRFGLAQLHQMRGRVGRSARRSFAYLLTEDGTPLAAPTLRRLHTLAAQEQLGAGVTISLADMDARGAGDLFGERQAGHVHAIGTELYQHLLGAELAKARGEPPPPPAPILHTEVGARIPADYVAEPNLRLELYRRLARLPSPEAADDLAEELADRFGALPEPVRVLLDLARLRAWCLANCVARLDAGPQAIALTPADPAQAAILAERFTLPTKAKDGRVIVTLSVASPSERLRRVCTEIGLSDG